MAVTAQLWTLSALSAELGTDRRTLAKKLHDLPPARTDGTGKLRSPKWRLADVLDHLADKTDDGDGAKAWAAEFRKWRALQEKAAYEQQMGTLVPKSTVIQREITIKGAFKRLPRSVAPVLAGKDTREITAVLTDRVNDIFRFLAGQLST